MTLGGLCQAVTVASAVFGRTAATYFYFRNLNGEELSSKVVELILTNSEE